MDALTLLLSLGLGALLFLLIPLFATLLLFLVVLLIFIVLIISVVLVIICIQFFCFLLDTNIILVHNI